jgi:hypothetical protein
LCDPTVTAFCENKIAKVAPAFYKMVQDDDVETWFKMQVWMLQYLIRDIKESDGVIIDAHDPEVFKTLLLNEGWESDSNHVAFAPFSTAGFHVICKRYLEQTSCLKALGSTSAALTQISTLTRISSQRMLNWSASCSTSASTRCPRSCTI